MSDIYSDYKSYTDSYGLVHPKNNGETSDNGIMYTAEYITALYDNKALTEQEKTRLIEVYKSCEKEPGLLMRYPDGTGGQQGPDDYVGAILASHYIDNGALAKRIAEYGINSRAQYKEELENTEKRKNSSIIYFILNIFSGFRGVGNVWNNSNPGYFTLSSFLGRFPAIVAHAKLAAGLKPSLLENAFWAISMLLSFTYKKEQHDQFRMGFMLARVGQDKSLFYKLFSKIFQYRFKKVCGSYGELASGYFNNENHPTVKWMKNSI